MRLKNEASSRKNFAVKLCRQLFTEEERSKSNVSGKKGGKAQLNPVKIDIVRTKTFAMFPTETGGSEKKAWSQCVVAIDEANRRLNRSKK